MVFILGLELGMPGITQSKVLAKYTKSKTVTLEIYSHFVHTYASKLLTTDAVRQAG